MKTLVAKNKTLEAAKQFMSDGIFVVPIIDGTKKPLGTGWQNLRLDIDKLQKEFTNGEKNLGIGILLGVLQPTVPDAAPPLAVFDIDIDDPGAVALSRFYPPPWTEKIFGHESKQNSHFLYRDIKERGGLKCCDGLDTLVELRGKGQQTIAPPSLHISGEPIEWSANGEYGKASYLELLRYTKTLSTEALLLRHWCSRSKHQAALDFLSSLAPESLITGLAELVQPADDDGDDFDVPQSLADIFGEKISRQVVDWLNPIMALPEEPLWIAKPSSYCRADDPIAPIVDDITDQELLRRIRQSAQRLKFDALMAGSVESSYYAGACGLCAILAGWTRCNAERIDRIFRTSGIYSNNGGWEKWWTERSHAGGQTRGQHVITNAIALTSTKWMYDPTHGSAAVRPDGGIILPQVGNSLPCLGSTNIALSGSIVDGPLLDMTTGHVFWFNGQDTTHNGEVVQTDTALGNSVTLAGVGGTSAGSPMFTGDFDNSYLNSTANNVTGFLYFCGKDPTQVDAPAIWRVGFSNTGVMNAIPDGGSTAYRTLAYSAVISNPPNVQCSPVTEVFNTNTFTDWIFLSVANLNYPCNGQTGCVMSLNLTTLTSWPPGPGGSVNTNGGTGMTAFSDVSTGGTSGIIIDNVAVTTPGNFPQASSIYFSWLGAAGPSLIGGGGNTFQCNSATTGGCFQKLTQASLQ